MVMQPSNNPDIALAQEWFEALDRWILEHGLCGYDPFDVKQHPFLRAAQPHYLRRKATSALCDFFPGASRRMLHVEPSENPKAHALTALGCLRMFQLTEDESYLDRARGHLDWLRERPAEGYAGLCWGYPFDVFGKGVDTPGGTPVVVVSAIAGSAFLLAYEIAREPGHLEAARSIANFLLDDVPRMEQEDGTVCFGYTPQDRRRVHNASLLAAEHLTRAGAASGETELLEAARPALQFALNRQREDGAWHYGELDDGEPYDEANLRMIDNHHTGFVLRSLHGIYEAAPDKDLKRSLRAGFKFYKTLFGANGLPVSHGAKYPVDIHACAEGILCPSVLSKNLFGAKSLAILSLRTAHAHMRQPGTSAPYYRKYPLFTSRIVYPRWGVAWMYWAIAEYLFHFAK